MRLPNSAPPSTSSLFCLPCFGVGACDRAPPPFSSFRIDKGSRPALHRQIFFEAVLYALDITCVSCVSFLFLL
ncbi:hypothetical protein I7I53_01253 [Histoplasma capsulatum var. duboisii H88]|uniref:Uncharacterized protein n=1 Tax=Ajellomyces capsulatus (strain H88) TaxID=544711 RepID=A0A8A1LMM1_AJEC8|nr:hypothetical protein I7I53_01253 [Histoplasma capsulatum var. duboisii H88]